MGAVLLTVSFITLTHSDGMPSDQKVSTENVKFKTKAISHIKIFFLNRV